MRYKPSGTEADYEPGALGESESDVPEIPNVKLFPKKLRAVNESPSSSKKRKPDERIVADSSPKKAKVRESSNSIADNQSQAAHGQSNEKKHRLERSNKDEDELETQERANLIEKDKVKKKDKHKDKHKHKGKDKENRHGDKDRDKDKHKKEGLDNTGKKNKEKKNDESSSKSPENHKDERNGDVRNKKIKTDRKKKTT